MANLTLDPSRLREKAKLLKQPQHKQAEWHMRTADTDLLDLVVRKLHSIDGIIDVWRVGDSDRRTILELDRNANEKSGLVIGVEIVNKGAQCALQRKHVVCVNHSQVLRHPPAPILVLVDEGGHVMGEEVWETENIARYRADSDVLFLGRGFVLFKDKVKRTEERRLRFEYGPQDFPELRMIQGIHDVVSGTLSPAADIYVKTMAKWDTSNPDSGTVLIGFNSSV